MGIENVKFIYESHKAEVSIDTLYKKPGTNPEYMIKVNADESSPLKFAYQNGEGLVLIENTNRKKSGNILGQFLKIKLNDYDSYIDFFNDFGFLFNIPFDRFAKINFETIIHISKRLNATLQLLNEINSYNPNYRKLFELSISIFFDSGWKFEIDGVTKQSHIYELADLIIYNSMDNVPECFDKQKAVKFGYIDVEDNLFDNYHLDFNEYKNIINGYSDKLGYDDFVFKSVTYLFVNYHPRNNKEREIIDLLFHYYHEIAIPSSIELGNIEYFSRFNPNGISHNFIDAIDDFAKFIIKNEIDTNIKGVHPVFNEEKMMPDWKIDSLLSAMYFSLFFMDSKKEMMRVCAYCERLFLVKRTCDTKKYCSSYCRNNAQAANHRLRIKEKAKQN